MKQPEIVDSQVLKPAIEQVIFRVSGLELHLLFVQLFYNGG